MHWTGFSDEARPKDFEHGVDRQQDVPQALRLPGVVRGVNRILIERDGIRDFDRHLPDVYLDAQRAQRGHNFFIEIGGRTGSERDRRGLGIRRTNLQLVIDEVEFHFEMAVAIRHHRRIEPARTEIERHVPPMVDQRRQFEADLSHDLRPHVECGVGVLPIREADCRPAFRGVRDSSGGWLRHRSLQVIRIAFAACSLHFAGQGEHPCAHCKAATSSSTASRGEGAARW